MAVVAVNVAVIRGNEILLTKRADLFVWCLPGGRVEPGETLAEAAIRETREETGLEVELTRLVGIYSRVGSFPDLHIVLFAARQTGGELCCQPGETLEVAFFTPDRLPDDVWLGYQQRIVDAMAGVGGGVAWRQEERFPVEGPITWPDVMRMADEAGVPRNEFYRQLLEAGTQNEVLQVGTER